MKKRERVYQCCGKVSFTFSQAEKCGTCQAKEQFKVGRERIKSALEKLGHTDVVFGGHNKSGQTCFTFTHQVCGTNQEWSATNLQKRLKEDPNQAPCSKCGAKRRTDAATKAYIAKYGMDPSRVKEWEGYSRLVRRLSDATYRKFKAEINPHNYPRGVKTYHLDHKVPIIDGFIQGLDPTILAHKSNLQMLSGPENISKGRKSVIYYSL